jgi:hypothetical protein
VIFLVIVALAALSPTANAGDNANISSHTLSQFLSKLPPDLPIYGIHIYPLYDGSTEIALLTTALHVGWQIRVHRYSKTGQVALEWQSASLPAEFAVSSANQFRSVQVDPMHEGTDIEFSGCKAHECPDSFGVLLYSPSRKKAFLGIMQNGKTTLSPELNEPDNQRIKDYLVRRLAAIKQIPTETKALTLWYSVAVPEWRNWQTRRTQNPVAARP